MNVSSSQSSHSEPEYRRNTDPGKLRHAATASGFFTRLEWRQTRADQLRAVLVQIRRLLDAHPRVEAASARTRFIRFSGSSLKLGIMDIIDTCGTSFAVPVAATSLAKGRPQ
jgi:hypothetical protein